MRLRGGSFGSKSETSTWSEPLPASRSSRRACRRPGPSSPYPPSSPRAAAVVAVVAPVEVPVLRRRVQPPRAPRPPVDVRPVHVRRSRTPPRPSTRRPTPDARRRPGRRSRARRRGWRGRSRRRRLRRRPGRRACVDDAAPGATSTDRDPTVAAPARAVAAARGGEERVEVFRGRADRARRVHDCVVVGGRARRRGRSARAFSTTGERVRRGAESGPKGRERGGRGAEVERAPGRAPTGSFTPSPYALVCERSSENTGGGGGSGVGTEGARRGSCARG